MSYKLRIEYNFLLKFNNNHVFFEIQLMRIGIHRIAFNWGSKLVFFLIKLNCKCSSANADLRSFSIFHLWKCLFKHLVSTTKYTNPWAASHVIGFYQILLLMFALFAVITLQINHFQLKVWWKLLDYTVDGFWKWKILLHPEKH
jgi:hypothetical protein